jgi:hypothetical protein
VYNRVVERLKRISEQDLVKISKKKPSYSVQGFLREYLENYQRSGGFSLLYSDLLRFESCLELYGQQGEDTLWKTVLYNSATRDELEDELKLIYALLTTDGESKFLKHLFIDRIDFCEFGNSQPFRIRVVNKFNDNHDYYYVKKADASRIYGLELEHILAPNRIRFLVNKNTLIEEHISGIPGDQFIGKKLEDQHLNRARVAKEFVKFNERCFAKLLGDMRSYNYVVVVTEDFDERQYRVRAIDFDQQSYEGNLKVYLPQFHRENQPVVTLVWKKLQPDIIRQYQKEECSLMARRAEAAHLRLEDLFDCMKQDEISKPEKIKDLASALSKFHKNEKFEGISSMGELTERHLRTILKV